MAWLRLDDGFATHPKLAALSDQEFRVWMRVLCYCSRYDDPTVDESLTGEVVGLTPARLQRFQTLGLLDQASEGVIVHDWTQYLPNERKTAARQARWRANRNGGVDA